MLFEVGRFENNHNVYAELDLDVTNVETIPTSLTAACMPLKRKRENSSLSEARRAH